MPLEQQESYAPSLSGIDSGSWIYDCKTWCNTSAHHFHAPPYTSERANKSCGFCAEGCSYSGPKLNVVNFTDIQLYIYEKCPHEELTIIMRLHDENR